MKKLLVCLTIGVLMAGCVSVKRYNQQLVEKRSVNELRSDVDYLNRKLQQYHPQLYLYTSKAELDNKFDSLKATITEPMTSREFYNLAVPVVVEVKQGHTRLFQRSPS